MSSNGYITLLDTVMTFQLGVSPEAIWPIAQNLCRYSKSYTIWKIGVNPQVSN